MTPPLHIAWRARHTPLLPRVALGHGPAARRLALHLLASANLGERSLRAVVARGLLGVMGDSDALPWVDGVEYLGRDPRAPSLRLPTAVEPTIALELVEQALLSRAAASGTHAPLAVTNAPPRLFSLASAQLVSYAGLRAWVDQG